MNSTNHAKNSEAVSVLLRFVMEYWRENHPAVGINDILNIVIGFNTSVACTIAANEPTIKYTNVEEIYHSELYTSMVRYIGENILNKIGKVPEGTVAEPFRKVGEGDIN